MPVFNGENPEGWVFHVEQYFHLNQLIKEEKLTTTVVCLDGDALSWFSWMEGRMVFASWADLKYHLLLHFQSTSKGSLCQKFLAIRQGGTVVEYRREFEILSAPLTGISKEVMESTFINGLKQEIQVELLISNSRGLGQIMDLAQHTEDKNKLLRGLGPRSNRPIYSPNRGENNLSDSYLGPNRGDTKVPKAYPTHAVIFNDRGYFPRRERRLTKAKIQGGKRGFASIVTRNFPWTIITNANQRNWIIR